MITCSLNVSDLKLTGTTPCSRISTLFRNLICISTIWAIIEARKTIVSLLPIVIVHRIFAAHPPHNTADNTLLISLWSEHRLSYLSDLCAFFSAALNEKLNFERKQPDNIGKVAPTVVLYPLYFRPLKFSFNIHIPWAFRLPLLLYIYSGWNSSI